MSFALNVIAKTALVLMGAALLSQLLRRASASLRHAVWVLALISVIVLPLAVALLPNLELPVLPEASTSVRLLPVTDQMGVVTMAQRGSNPATAYGNLPWSVLL